MDRTEVALFAIDEIERLLRVGMYECDTQLEGADIFLASPTYYRELSECIFVHVMAHEAIGGDKCDALAKLLPLIDTMGQGRCAHFRRTPGLHKVPLAR